MTDHNASERETANPVSAEANPEAMNSASSEAQEPRAFKARLFAALKWSAILTAMLILFGITFVYSVSFPEDALEPGEGSVQILDRDGLMLREPRRGDAPRQRWIPLSEAPQVLIDALIAVEDQRFYDHSGVDSIAVARAALTNLRAGEVRSGASTITMQVVRMMRPKPRTFRAKLFQAVWALRLERAATKDEILEQYINRLPFGRGIVGVELAAERFFGKPARALSLAQAAFIAGLPQSPMGYDPYRFFDRAQARQRFVLERMLDEGFIDDEQHQRATREPLTIEPLESAFLAPHFVDHVLSSASLPKDARVIESTLDRRYQALMEGVIRAHIKDLKDKDVSQAAAVLLDNATGEVLALVGSPDFFAEDGGQVNGAMALRQPGSTLKPFTYGVAMDAGVITPATLIADVPTFYQTPRGTYSPQNYDLRHYGPVRARVALASSLNVSAVKVLSRLGVDSLLAWLIEAGFESLDETPDHYGLGLTLGGGEVRLMELAEAYRMLARGGLHSESVWVRSAFDSRGEPIALLEPIPERRLLKEETAYQITGILSDRSARALSFGLGGPLEFDFPVAAKTGTSADFRDIWTVGYTSRHTLAVWVGNFDGRPMGEVSGISGAAPIFRDIMLGLYEDGDEPDGFVRPERIDVIEICSLSGDLPGEGCPHRVVESFPEGHVPQHVCEVHRTLRIDPENGLLAGPACEDFEERAFVVLPSAYDAWLQGAGEELAPREASPRCPEGALEQRAVRGERAEVAILRPTPGATFMWDPELPAEVQMLTLEARASAEIQRVRWRVDGVLIEEVGRPFEARWSLRPGLHDVTVEGLGQGGEVLGEKRVRVQVE